MNIKVNPFNKLDIPKVLEAYRNQMNFTQLEFAKKGGMYSSEYIDVIKYRKTLTILEIDTFCRNAKIPFHLLVHQAIIESIDDFSAKSIALEKLTPLILEFDKNIQKMLGDFYMK